MVDYNLDEEEDNSGIVRWNVEVFFENNNNLQNVVLTIKKRGEHGSKLRKEIIFEMSTPTPNMNLTRNHLPN